MEKCIHPPFFILNMHKIKVSFYYKMEKVAQRGRETPPAIGQKERFKGTLYVVQSVNPTKEEVVVHLMKYWED